MRARSQTHAHRTLARMHTQPPPHTTATPGDSPSEPESAATLGPCSPGSPGLQLAAAFQLARPRPGWAPSCGRARCTHRTQSRAGVGGAGVQPAAALGDRKTTARLGLRLPESGPVPCGHLGPLARPAEAPPERQASPALLALRRPPLAPACRCSWARRPPSPSPAETTKFTERSSGNWIYLQFFKSSEPMFRMGLFFQWKL